MGILLTYWDISSCVLVLASFSITLATKDLTANGYLAFVVFFSGILRFSQVLTLDTSNDQSFHVDWDRGFRQPFGYRKGHYCNSGVLVCLVLWYIVVVVDLRVVGVGVKVLSVVKLCLSSLDTVHLESVLSVSESI
ncbi:hypothetical protein Tco_0457731 [Tanacetum coccineum]